MSNFKLQQDGFTSYTCIANSFIERYMPKAAGEFVKIYIYLLKCVEENRSELSISRIADAFENTQKDVVRALKYWEKKGLLNLSFDGDILTSLRIISLPDVKEENGALESSFEEPAISVRPALLKKRQYSKDEIAAFTGRDDVSQLVYIVQKYLGRTLSGADVNSILFYNDGLKLPVDVIEYLFEFCVSKNKKEMRDIDRTAIAWAEKGIDSVEAAKALNVVIPENARSVMRAFGLSARQPSKKEADFIGKWTSAYGFSESVITEACVRTINTIHQPSFEYADSILSNWHENGVKSSNDIKSLDEKYAGKASYRSAKTKTEEKQPKQAKNTRQGFAHRDYDYVKMEELLFNR